MVFFLSSVRNHIEIMTGNFVAKTFLNATISYRSNLKYGLSGGKLNFLHEKPQHCLRSVQVKCHIAKNTFSFLLCPSRSASFVIVSNQKTK